MRTFLIIILAALLLQLFGCIGLNDPELTEGSVPESELSIQPFYYNNDDKTYRFADDYNDSSTVPIPSGLPTASDTDIYYGLDLHHRQGQLFTGFTHYTKRHYPPGCKAFLSTGERMVTEYELKNGLKDGLFKRWWSNGKLQKEEMYKEGRVDGASRTWYKNGQLRSAINWKMGWFHGIWSDWDEEGFLIREEHYKNDHTHGYLRSWFRGTEQLYEEAYYEKGQLVGPQKYWHFNGNLKEEIDSHYRKTWHENGQLFEERQRKNWVLHGWVTAYDPSGKLLSKKQFVEGTGTLMGYYETGDLESETEYVNGRYHGKRTVWFPNGTMQERTHYKNGHRYGSYTIWHGNGNLYRESQYDIVNNYETLVDTERYWHENGNPLSERYYKEGKIVGIEKHWYENGKIRSESTYEDGMMVSRKYWDEQGKYMGETTY